MKYIVRICYFPTNLNHEPIQYWARGKDNMVWKYDCDLYQASRIQTAKNMADIYGYSRKCDAVRVANQRKELAKSEMARGDWNIVVSVISADDYVMQVIEDVVNESLRNAGIYADWVEAHRNPLRDGKVVVKWTISWGDWKHEHMQSEWIVGRCLSEYDENVEYYGELVTEENGSDCYSADHAVEFHF